MQRGVGSLLRYEDFVQVGEGAYGHVYRARDKQGGPGTEAGTGAGAGQGGSGRVALKRLIVPPGSSESAGFPVFAIREITFLKRLRHPNIVRLLNIVSSKGCEELDSDIKTETLKDDPGVLSRKGASNTFLVFEYVEHDLSGLIDSRYPFDDEQCRFLALQMMRALAYLQDNRIMHRDIKSANFLVSNMLVLKLADFGMARQVPCEADAVLLRDGQTQHPAMALLNCGGGRGSSPRDVFSNNVVTIWYRPPELLLGDTKYFWRSVDVWSAGCVLAELQMLRPLFPGKSVPEQLNMIMDVLGAPTEANWEGVSRLTNYGRLVQLRAEQQARTQYSHSFKAAFENVITEDLLGFIDRLLVLDPEKRMLPVAALKSSKYLQACSEKDIRPLGVGMSSLHEFETKRNLRMKRDKEKQRKAMMHEQEQTNNGNIDHDIRPNSQVQSLKRSSVNISSL